MDVSQYLEIFIDETKEHLQSLNTSILDLEQDPSSMDTVNEIFRAAHSLKGMAGTMGFKRMQALTHDMENVFSEVRNGTFAVTASIIDVLFQCLDALDEYLNNIQSSADEGTNENKNLIDALNGFLNSKGDAPAAKAEAPAAKASGESTSDKDKWKTLSLNDSQTHVLQKAKAQGHNVIGLTVYVQESCILKAARAFLVYKTLEELGEIIVSVPSAQDIEDEKFEYEFSLIMVSKESAEKAIAAAKSVSEIQEVVGGIVELPEVSEAETKAMELEIAENKSVDAGANTPAKTDATKAVDKKKPVVNRTVRVDIEKLDVLMNLVSELIIAKNSLVSAATSSGEESTYNLAVNEQIEYLEGVTTNLHESVMKVRMVPIETVVNKFPRMIRDLQKKLGKRMELYMTGEDTELDRTVVDEIGDPLMHLLRNSADHGIEADEKLRVQRGKPAVGTIHLNAYQDGNNVVIEVKDDGNGIDVEKVKEKALERGTITEEQAAVMSDKDIINLLFLPSFSTAKTISDVSGRGVGLDVVRSKIESLSGEVDVKSTLGEGSVWTIRLPLTLAIIQSLMVIVGGEKYAIPLGNIQTLESIQPSEIKYVQQKEVINLRGDVIPIIRLNQVLDCESTRGADEEMTVVIVKKGDRMAGLVIDELTGQQEIVIKSLGKYIGKTKVISGATILGDGEVALIIDPNALI
ncbi:MAG: chemotaxis protein CheA [Lachnospiraceae bacterium]|nr:chemotaxis protein CheA [Lachnospiraceae bacterium]